MGRPPHAATVRPCKKKSSAGVCGVNQGCWAEICIDDLSPRRRTMKIAAEAGIIANGFIRQLLSGGFLCQYLSGEIGHGALDEATAGKDP
jgi:hypothetical protein